MRISRRLCPISQWNVPVNFTDIPDSAIDREWGDGEILVLWQCRFNNNAAAESDYLVRPLIDNVGTQAFNDMVVELPAASEGALSGHFLWRIKAGRHRLVLQARSLNSGGGFVAQDGCVIIAIELPNADPLPEDGGRLIHFPEEV